MDAEEMTCRVDLGQQNEEMAALAVDWPPTPAGTTWNGTVRGPYCRYARTLAADYPLDPEGRAVIPEPCYWTPGLPFLYRLRLEAFADDAAVQTIEQTIGLRRLDARARSLYWDGRRTVLRGVRVALPSAELGPNHESSPDTASRMAEVKAVEASAWIDHYDAEFCDIAAELGTPLMVDLRNGPHDGVIRLLSPAVAPAVVGTVVERPPDDFDVIRSGMLLAQAIELDQPSQLADWADLVVIEFDEPASVPRWVADLPKPVIAMCPKTTSASLSEARTQVDRLQAALAPQFDFAGYFV